MLTMLLPSTTTFLPNLYAVLIICCTRSTLDAKVATKIRVFLWSANRVSKVLPTVFSEGVKPGRSALVESHIRASTPFLPISAKRCKSIASPNTGV